MIDAAQRVVFKRLRCRPSDADLLVHVYRGRQNKDTSSIEDVMGAAANHWYVDHHIHF